MKNLLKRSTDLIIVIEWTCFSTHIAAEDYDKRLMDLLTWLEKAGYSFWKVLRKEYPGGSQKQCVHEKFEKIDKFAFKEFCRVLREHDSLVDVIIAADHIDINSL